MIVMKPLAGGTFQNAASAIRFCLSQPGISTVVPGICNERELNEDIVEVLKNPNFTKEDEKKLKKKLPNSVFHFAGLVVIVLLVMVVARPGLILLSFCVSKAILKNLVPKIELWRPTKKHMMNIKNLWL